MTWPEAFAVVGILWGFIAFCLALVLHRPTKTRNEEDT